jgi:hypothetical protein
LVRGGLKIVAQAGDQLVAFDLPMSADALEDLARRFQQAVAEWRRLEAAEAGEKPPLARLKGGAPWN